MNTRTCFTAQEKEEILQEYKGNKKRALLGVGIILFCLFILETIAYQLPELMLGPLYHEGKAWTMGAVINQCIIAFGGLAVILGIIFAGYWQLKISDLPSEVEM